MLCCDLAKFENIIMTLLDCRGQAKVTTFVNGFSYPVFIFLIFAIFGAKNEIFFFFRSVKVLIELAPPLRFLLQSHLLSMKSRKISGSIAVTYEIYKNDIQSGPFFLPIA